MTTSSMILMVVAALAAATDWWAVAAQRRPVELVAKPAVLVALIGAAATLQPADQTVRWTVVAALVCGLAGDVLLMLDKFVPGAAAFLVGHLAYIAAFLQVPQHLAWLLVGAVGLVVLLIAVARPIASGARRKNKVLGAVVLCYLIALGTAAVLGLGTAVPAAMAGMVAFAASDSLLGWGRFVGPAPGGRTLVHMTYHVAQALMVVSLLSLG